MRHQKLSFEYSILGYINMVFNEYIKYSDSWAYEFFGVDINICMLI